jgi:large subunit ribosomal protein L6
MSRIGKKPIQLPTGVSCVLSGREAKVKGPKGELTVSLPPKVSVVQEGDELTLTVSNPAEARQAAFWGLGRSLLAGAVQGVAEGFTKKLEFSGVGFRAAVSGGDLVLNVGFSHPVKFTPPPGIELSVEGNVITASGIDKQMVGETAARIRAVKPVEPYKGKGIKYVGEIVRRKAGKVAKTAA